MTNRGNQTHRVRRSGSQQVQGVGWWVGGVGVERGVDRDGGGGKRLCIPLAWSSPPAAGLDPLPH